MTQLRLFETEEVEDDIFVIRIPSDDRTERNVIKQISVLMAACKIYSDRSATRGQAWKDHPWYDSVHHIRDIGSRFNHLIERMMRGEEITQEDFDAAEDWALDLINYSAFFIRKIKGE